MTVTSWTMYAAWDERNGGYYKHVGSDPRYTTMHGTPAEDVKTVDVAIDSDGDYYGWQNLDKLTEPPVMIYRHPILFNICFPNGVEAEVKAGRGRAVRLRIEAADE